MKHRKTEGRCSVDRARIGGGLLIGALASGALAAGALSTAGQAQASCVSAGGWFSIGSGCTTTNPGDFALAIGPGATATASGGANTAISWGVGASATATGVHNTAIAIGNAAAGSDPRALARGGNTVAVAGSEPYKLAADGTVAVQRDNTAIAIGTGAQSLASGQGSTAISQGTEATSTAQGVRNLAYSRGTRASARAVGGSGNTAIAIGNPVEAEDTGGVEAQLAIKRPTNTTAVAGDIGMAGGGSTEAYRAVGDNGSSNNTAIAIGDGTAAGAGDGNGNYASALGNRSVAAAIGGDRNRAVVFGNRSIASAGVPIPAVDQGNATRASLSRDPSSGNTAVAVGNDDVAVAGPGNLNRARVFGNNSTARAFGERQRVTSVGDNVNKSSEESTQK